MIGNCPGVTPASEIGDHSYVAYIEVDDVDALCTEFRANGALIKAPPASRPYGMREMLVAMPDGHRIMIGQELRRDQTKPDSIPLDELIANNDE